MRWSLGWKYLAKSNGGNISPTGGWSFWILELEGTEALIKTILFQKGLMGARLDDSSTIKDDYRVGMLDSREAVSDDEWGASHHKSFESLLY